MNINGLKNKEVIIGLILIIVLGSIALFLLIRREIGGSEQAYQSQAGQETMPSVDSAQSEEAVSEAAGTAEGQEPAGDGQKDGETVLQAEPVATDSLTQAGKNLLEKAQLYRILGDEGYQKATLAVRKEDDGQLEELFGYWDAYKLEAVDDLVRLERLQAISHELEGTNSFYYYGDKDVLGRPSGRGLAVYANNTYYCGDWKEGLRHGEGMWLQVAVYDESNSQLNLGLVEHLYNGSWSKDLPNGQGQEHFSYDYGILAQESRTIANVIGEFKDGYYNGEMYVMTVNNAGNTTDWTGVCSMGVWEALFPGPTTDGVWLKMEQDESGEAEYHYLFPEENNNFGVYGMKS